MEELLLELEQIKIQINTGRQQLEIGQVWGQSIIDTCNRAIKIASNLN